MPRRAQNSRRRSRRRDEMSGPLRDRFLSTSVSPLAIPDRFRTKLVYAGGGQITSASYFVDKIWNINSVFDPDQSGVGHQPRYFDQFALLYNRYRVLSATFDVSIRQRATHGITCYLIPNNATTGLTGAGIPAELRRSGVARITSSNQPPVAFRVKFDPASVTGVSRSQYLSDDRFQALTTANPSEAICLHQYVESMDGSTAIDCEYVMQIVYEVEFFDAVDVSSSLTARVRGGAPAVATPPEQSFRVPLSPAAVQTQPHVLVWSEERQRYEPAP